MAAWKGAADIQQVARPQLFHSVSVWLHKFSKVGVLAKGVCTGQAWRGTVSGLQIYPFAHRKKQLTELI